MTRNCLYRIGIASVIACIVFAGLVPARAAHPETGLRRSAIVKAVENVSPAVVNINTRQVVRESNPFYRNDPFFNRFFENFYEPFQREYETTSLGSGVVIDREGHVLTNEHVVMSGSGITVTLSDGREFAASVVGSDPETDLAILRVEDAADLPFIPMGDSDILMIGETVIAIGNPFGLSHSVTTGVVSALHRSLKTEGGRVYADLVQTDASINPGNSGGPLLTIDGELIGINTAIYGGSAQGIGFAIPIDRARRIVDDLIRFGHVRTAWLGLRIVEVVVGRQRVGRRRVKEDIQLQVGAVFPGGPADLAGIRLGDVVSGVESVKVQSWEDYAGALRSYTAGNTIRITLNDGRKMADVKATALPLDKANEATVEMLGVEAGDITSRYAQRFRGYLSGIMVKRILSSRGAAARAGIQPGDIIRQVNDSRIENMKNFGEAILEAYQGQNVLLLVQRGSYGYYLTLKL